MYKQTMKLKSMKTRSQNKALQQKDFSIYLVNEFESSKKQNLYVTKTSSE